MRRNFNPQSQSGYFDRDEGIPDFEASVLIRPEEMRRQATRAAFEFVARGDARTRRALEKAEQRRGR